MLNVGPICLSAARCSALTVIAGSAAGWSGQSQNPLITHSSMAASPLPITSYRLIPALCVSYKYVYHCRKEPNSSPPRKESKARESKAAEVSKAEKPRDKTKSRSRSPGKRGRSSSPPPTKIHIGRLTRNVNREHLQEIFSTFGKIKDIEFGSERMRPWLNKGNQGRLRRSY